MELNWLPGTSGRLSEAAEVGAFALARTTKLDGDAGFVVPYHAPGNLPDGDDFTDGRFEGRLQRQTTERQIQHFTMNDLSAAACELGERASGATFVNAERRGLGTSLFGDDLQLFCEPRLFQCGTAENDAEMTPFG